MRCHRCDFVTYSSNELVQHFMDNHDSTPPGYSSTGEQGLWDEIDAHTLRKSSPIIPDADTPADVESLLQRFIRTLLGKE